MRGDDLLTVRASATARGTPPRARGRRMVAAMRSSRPGNTPACAGTTHTANLSLGVRLEHPRVRGDDCGGPDSTALAGGTPPRARGRHQDGAVGRLVARNTPACAGTTLVPEEGTMTEMEHPRVRGDDRMVMSSTGRYCGTPPRARGRLYRPRFEPGDRGNTPACAGTTTYRAMGWGTLWEHPRVRGDDGTALQTSISDIGTPPRARGRLGATPVHRGGHRNTPACAGTTGDI